MKKGLYRSKFNSYRCTHIKHQVIATYYPKNNPKANHKNDIKLRGRDLNPVNKHIAVNSHKGIIFADLGLRLVFLC